ncbi:hypothetical protein Goari_016643 [Gossypium aridum]|uniref:Uncharacterized protein n=1 Tax=Gossypium aridum TaxID=34290 RepID=A0A7J8WJK8_GOSAI|nr:hypothetical protein [Gossypium aridum]
MALSKSNQFKKQHSLHFNPTFEEATMVDVVVNEGILDANNHTTVIFKNNTQHNFSRKTNLKGLGNRFKASSSSCVSFAKLMKTTAELISSDLSGQSTMDMSMKEGE